MTLTSVGMIVNKRECWRYLSGESYEKSYSRNVYVFHKFLFGMVPLSSKQKVSIQ